MRKFISAFIVASFFLAGCAGTDGRPEKTEHGVSRAALTKLAQENKQEELLAIRCADMGDADGRKACESLQESLRKTALDQQAILSYRKTAEAGGGVNCRSLSGATVKADCVDYRAGLRMMEKIKSLPGARRLDDARFDCRAYLSDVSSGATEERIRNMIELCEANVASARQSLAGSASGATASGAIENVPAPTVP